MTPPPINPSQFDPANPTTRTPEVTKSYAEGVIEVGAEIGVPVVNLWEAVWKEAGEKFEGLSRLLSDGLHLTAEGYKVLSFKQKKYVKNANVPRDRRWCTTLS
jgi:lysophospholipase L1-like esterase